MKIEKIVYYLVDGGAAILLEPSEDETGIQDYLLRSDGSGGDMLCLKAGGSLKPASKETIKNKEHYILSGRFICI